MTKKETAVKAIKEMNISLLDVVLEDHLPYMEVSKELFLATLNQEFQRIKAKGIMQFDVVAQGHCNTCYEGCGGYTFMTSEKEALDILIVEKDNIIQDLFLCNCFQNNGNIDKKYMVTFSFKTDEHLNYEHSDQALGYIQRIENSIHKFNKFENNITDLDTFSDWVYRSHKLFDEVKDKVYSYSFLELFVSVHRSASTLDDLIVHHAMAQKALEKFQQLNLSDEEKVIDWLLSYEDHELRFTFFIETTENWKKTNLVLFTNHNYQERNVIIDIKKYRLSLLFQEIYADLYDTYLEKFPMTDELYDIFGYNMSSLSQLLAIHQLYPTLLKKHKFYESRKGQKFKRKKWLQ